MFYDDKVNVFLFLHEVVSKNVSLNVFSEGDHIVEGFQMLELYKYWRLCWPWNLMCHPECPKKEMIQMISKFDCGNSLLDLIYPLNGSHLKSCACFESKMFSTLRSLHGLCGSETKLNTTLDLNKLYVPNLPAILLLGCKMS